MKALYAVAPAALSGLVPDEADIAGPILNNAEVKGKHLTLLEGPGPDKDWAFETNAKTGERQLRVSATC